MISSQIINLLYLHFIKEECKYETQDFDIDGFGTSHLNIAETLWRIMKGQGIRPQDYDCAGTLFLCNQQSVGCNRKESEDEHRS
jgi:hypothetical protein